MEIDSFAMFGNPMLVQLVKNSTERISLIIPQYKLLEENLGEKKLL